jgi:hypothetical protein
MFLYNDPNEYSLEMESINSHGFVAEMDKATEFVETAQPA